MAEREAPGDYCKVETVSEGVWRVRHYPHRWAKAPCCRLRVEVTDADRAAATGADPFGHAAALLRGDREIDRRHGTPSASSAALELRERAPWEEPSTR